MKYDIYLFDADETLFDYNKAEENALIETFSQNNLSYSEDIRSKYRDINNELWLAFERQEIGKDELQVERFFRLFHEIEVECDPSSFNGKYHIELGKGNYLIDGAYEICRALYEENKKMYIVTNGTSAVQKTRIANSKIKDFISDLFVSEDIGYQKPNKKYFDYVLSQIEKIDIRKILIIGDSLTSDIQGGYNAGIDTCWFNPNKNKNLIGITPTYEITDLSEILTF